MSERDMPTMSENVTKKIDIQQRVSPPDHMYGENEATPRIKILVDKIFRQRANSIQHYCEKNNVPATIFKIIIIRESEKNYNVLTNNNTTTDWGSRIAYIVNNVIEGITEGKLLDDSVAHGILQRRRETITTSTEVNTPETYSTADYLDIVIKVTDEIKEKPGNNSINWEHHDTQMIKLAYQASKNQTDVGQFKQIIVASTGIYMEIDQDAMTELAVSFGYDEEITDLQLDILMDDFFETIKTFNIATVSEVSISSESGISSEIMPLFLVSLLMLVLVFNACSGDDNPDEAEVSDVVAATSIPEVVATAEPDPTATATAEPDSTAAKPTATATTIPIEMTSTPEPEGNTQYPSDITPGSIKDVNTKSFGEALALFSGAEEITVSPNGSWTGNIETGSDAARIITMIEELESRYEGKAVVTINSVHNPDDDTYFSSWRIVMIPDGGGIETIGNFTVYTGGPLNLQTYDGEVHGDLTTYAIGDGIETLSLPDQFPQEEGYKIATVIDKNSGYPVILVVRVDNDDNVTMYSWNDRSLGQSMKDSWVDIIDDSSAASLEELTENAEWVEKDNGTQTAVVVIDDVERTFTIDEDGVLAEVAGEETETIQIAGERLAYQDALDRFPEGPVENPAIQGLGESLRTEIPDLDFLLKKGIDEETGETIVVQVPVSEPDIIIGDDGEIYMFVDSDIMPKYDRFAGWVTEEFTTESGLVTINAGIDYTSKGYRWSEIRTATPDDYIESGKIADINDQKIIDWFEDIGSSLKESSLHGSTLDNINTTLFAYLFFQSVPTEAQLLAIEVYHDLYLKDDLTSTEQDYLDSAIQILLSHSNFKSGQPLSTKMNGEQNEWIFDNGLEFSINDSLKNGESSWTDTGRITGVPDNLYYIDEDNQLHVRGAITLVDGWKMSSILSNSLSILLDKNDILADLNTDNTFSNYQLLIESTMKIHNVDGGQVVVRPLWVDSKYFNPN